MAQPFAIESDSELVDAVRDKTSYSDSNDELPGDANSGQMSGILSDAKRMLYIRTGSDQWYNDLAYGQALVALTALKAKEAVENINISSYGIGDESLSFSNADPDESQQITSWSDEVNEALDKSDANFEHEQDNQMQNTASYIG